VRTNDSAVNPVAARHRGGIRPNRDDGLRQRLVLSWVDGRYRTHLTADGELSSYPLWIDDHEVWFSRDDGSGPGIWRVRID
jgi:hypothetical protein